MCDVGEEWQQVCKDADERWSAEGFHGCHDVDVAERLSQSTGMVSHELMIRGF